MMDKANIPFEVQRINVLAYYTMGIKKKIGGLPVAERTDGTLMSDSVPLARYIARHSGFYPTDPMEAFWCDKYTELYQPIVNTTFKWAIATGNDKKKLYDQIAKEEIPKAIKGCEGAFREDKFMIGDGSKIMMCDFFFGRVYADLIANPNSFITSQDRMSICVAHHEFKLFGEKFLRENQ
jgi:glutathione S-transferase